MAAMASKFNFECVIQYYTDQWLAVKHELRVATLINSHHLSSPVINSHHLSSTFTTPTAFINSRSLKLEPAQSG